MTGCWLLDELLGWLSGYHLVLNVAMVLPARQVPIQRFAIGGRKAEGPWFIPKPKPIPPLHPFSPAAQAGREVFLVCALPQDRICDVAIALENKRSRHPNASTVRLRLGLDFPVEASTPGLHLGP